MTLSWLNLPQGPFPVRREISSEYQGMYYGSYRFQSKNLRGILSKEKKGRWPKVNIENRKQ